LLGCLDAFGILLLQAQHLRRDASVIIMNITWPKLI
jgi:hypothetical protein